MTDLTTQQLIIIGVIFGVGLLIGFMLKPSGAKWRRLYDAEHDAHKRLRLDYDRLEAKVAPATRVEHETLRRGSF